jgi:hypothetical protein
MYKVAVAKTKIILFIQFLIDRGATEISIMDDTGGSGGYLVEWEI